MKGLADWDFLSLFKKAPKPKPGGHVVSKRWVEPLGWRTPPGVIPAATAAKTDTRRNNSPAATLEITSRRKATDIEPHPTWVGIPRSTTGDASTSFEGPISTTRKRWYANPRCRLRP